jgi:hypothetical protein
MLVDDVGFGSVWRVERYLEMDSEQERRNILWRRCCFGARTSEPKVLNYI